MADAKYGGAVGAGDAVQKLVEEVNRTPKDIAAKVGAMLQK